MKRNHQNSNVDTQKKFSAHYPRISRIAAQTKTKNIEISRKKRN